MSRYSPYYTREDAQKLALTRISTCESTLGEMRVPPELWPPDLAAREYFQRLEELAAILAGHKQEILDGADPSDTAGDLALLEDRLHAMHADHMAGVEAGRKAFEKRFGKRAKPAPRTQPQPKDSRPRRPSSAEGDGINPDTKVYGFFTLLIIIGWFVVATYAFGW